MLPMLLFITVIPLLCLLTPTIREVPLLGSMLEIILLTRSLLVTRCVAVVPLFASTMMCRPTCPKSLIVVWSLGPRELVITTMLVGYLFSFIHSGDVFRCTNLCRWSLLLP